VEHYGLYLRAEAGDAIVLIPEVSVDRIPELRRAYQPGDVVRVRLLDWIPDRRMFKATMLAVGQQQGPANGPARGFVITDGWLEYFDRYGYSEERVVARQFQEFAAQPPFSQARYDELMAAIGRCPEGSVICVLWRSLRTWGLSCGLEAPSPEEFPWRTAGRRGLVSNPDLLEQPAQAEPASHGGDRSTGTEHRCVSLDPRALARIKLLHTLIWAVIAGAIVALPLLAWLERYAWVLAVNLGVAIELVVLLANRGRCPLTDVAARHTDDRADNFDIYLPEWLARHNKVIFTVLLVLGDLFALWCWQR
jgi:hypothetical protein